MTIAKAGRTVTRAGGVWRTAVTPRFSTVYRARWGSVTSEAVAIGVRPRVRLTVRSGAASARVVGARSFAGRQVLLQQLVRGGRWETIARGVLNDQSSVRFGVRLSGRLADAFVRVLLPRRAAGRGYLAGISPQLALRSGD